MTTATSGRPIRVAFAGVFAGQVADRVRARIEVPCDVVQGGEGEVLDRLGDVDVLVSMAFTREMARAAPRLRLVQVPGAGLDRARIGAPRRGWHLGPPRTAQVIVQHRVCQRH